MPVAAYACWAGRATRRQRGMKRRHCMLSTCAPRAMAGGQVLQPLPNDHSRVTPLRNGGEFSRDVRVARSGLRPIVPGRVSASVTPNAKVRQPLPARRFCRRMRFTAPLQVLSRSCALQHLAALSPGAVISLPWWSLAAIPTARRKRRSHGQHGDERGELGR